LETSSFVNNEYEPTKYSEKEIWKNLYEGRNIQLEEFQEVFGKHSGGEDKLVLNPTSDPIISWGIWKPQSKNLGVIVMTAFTPILDTRGAVRLIRDLLTNQLKDTNALLWDLRSNGGGSVPFADALPQLFGYEIVPGFEQAIVPGFRRAIVAPANEGVFLNSTPSDPWRQAYLNAKPGDRYVPLTRITPILEANFWGSAYIKPVGILHNGNCYSACDLFSASMKDNNGATIFGEDGTSGAGGYT
jgi:C-terminal processing protease CtpA/Prc